MASGDTLVVWRAGDNEPPASAYAQITVRNGHLLLAFDTTTAEGAVFAGILPRNYAGGGITCYCTWAADTATTGTIGWTVEFEADTAQDIDSDGFATAQTITAATVSGTAGIPSTTNVAVTNGANMDSIAVGLPFRVRLKRDVANDTAAGDAHFIALELKET
jgi:hypothetical protein